MKNEKIIINLASSKGNAFYLMAVAEKIGKELKKSKEERNKILEELTQGDYENLLNVLEKYYGDYIELID